MADVVTLGDVSTKDTGSGSELKTGGRRKHNMPKKCVEMKMKGGMSRSAAVKACYPQTSKSVSKISKAVLSTIPPGSLGSSPVSGVNVQSKYPSGSALNVGGRKRSKKSKKKKGY